MGMDEKESLHDKFLLSIHENKESLIELRDILDLASYEDYVNRVKVNRALRDIKNLLEDLDEI